MLYNLIGRVLWRIVRGYLRHTFPHAKRDLAFAGAATLALAAAGVLLSRGRGDELRGARRS